MKKLILFLILSSHLGFSSYLFAQNSTIVPSSIQLPNVAVLGTCSALKKGQMVFLTSDNLTYYCNGIAWESLLTATNNNTWLTQSTDIINRNSGNVGIGNVGSPAAKLDVKSNTSLVANFNGGNQMYVFLTENDIYKGYFGSFSGGADDVDFGTSGGNNTGKVHLTIRAIPKLTVNTPGYVGIGTTDPISVLNLYETNNRNQIYFHTNTSGITQYDGFQIGVNDQNHGLVWNNENMPILFGTNNLQRLRIAEDGNIGINNNMPLEKLDIIGNTKIDGEINRPSTTNANLIPVCYGLVYSGGANEATASTANFTSSRISAGNYQISITNELYDFQKFITTATIVGTAAPFLIATSGSFGVLQVNTYNIAGAAADASFSFVVYKK